KTIDDTGRFLAVIEKETGLSIQIRYGRLREGRGTPEWISVPHTICDGVGGFAKILRDRDLDSCEKLPQFRMKDEVQKSSRLAYSPSASAVWKDAEGS